MSDQQSSSDLPKPSAEGKLYDPDGYEELVSLYSTITISLISVSIFIFLLCIAAHDSDAVIGIIVFGSIMLTIIGVSFRVSYMQRYRKYEEKVAERKKQEQDKILLDVNNVNDNVIAANKALEEHKVIMDKIQNAQKSGDIIVSGNHAPVVINGQIVNSYNSIVQEDPELASAIKLLGGYIEESKSKEAAEYFDEFHKLIAEKDSSKVTLKALWNGMIKVLPEIENLKNVVTKVTSLFL